MDKVITTATTATTKKATTTVLLVFARVIYALSLLGGILGLLFSLGLVVNSLRSPENSLPLICSLVVLLACVGWLLGCLLIHKCQVDSQRSAQPLAEQVSIADV